MADNVTLPGTGAVVASDDIGGFQHQRIKVTLGADGVNDGDVSASNPMPVMPYGELVEAIEAMRFAIMSLTKTIGYALPNAQGFPIMEARQATAGNLNVTLAATTLSSGTLTTLTTLTNQSQMGGFATQDQIPALMHLQADNLRRNISVT
jgi:hypothetical protein